MNNGSFYWRYLQPRVKQLAVLAILLLSGIALQLANPQVVRYFLDTAQSHGQQRLLFWAAIAFVGVALIQRLLEVVTGYVSQNLGWSATNALRYDLAVHCLGLDLPFYKTHLPGELIERIDGDVTALANFFSEFAVQVAGNALLILGILILLLRENLWMGLGLAIYTLLILLVLRVVQPVSIRRWREERRVSAELMGYMEERISGAEEIQATGMVDYAMHGLFRRMRLVLEKVRLAFLTDTLVYNLTNLLAAVGYALGLGIGAYLYLQGQATIGAVYLIVTYVGMLSGPLQNIRRQVQDLQQATASLLRIQELFEIKPEVVDRRTGVEGKGERGENRYEKAGHYNLQEEAVGVEFRGVTFGYEGNGNVLKGVSFSLEPGKVLGVLGRTGSGKTTLTRLLFRLYDPDQGTVLLSRQDLRQLPLTHLRSRVGMVTQEVQLFQASIRDNLTFFDPDVTDEQLQQALQTLGLWEKLSSLPGGLNASLTPDGSGLSAGESQLLAFARVFLKNPGLVILDEASSRLDPITERLMERAIDALLEQRTGIIIAHRLQTIQRADQILILEEGRVVEFGDRQALACDPASRFSQLLQTGIEAALA